MQPNNNAPGQKPPDLPQPLPPQAFIPSYGEQSQAAPQSTPTPTMPSSAPQANNYEFIMNPGKPSRRNLFAGSGTALRIGVVVGGILLLIIIFAVLKSLFSGGDTSLPSLISVAQTQEAITQYTQNGLQNTVSQNAKNFAVAANLAVGSEQQQLLTYLQTNHHKVGNKTLALKTKQDTLTQLTNAATSSTYDSTFTDLMQTQLNDYATALKAAYAANPGPKGRTLLADDYKAVQLLDKQLNASN